MSSSIRQKIIDYYDDLKNRVDILAENHISRNPNDVDTNNMRDKYIQIIDEILKLNLQYLKSNLVNDKPEHYFAPKFCFLLKDYKLSISQLLNDFNLFKAYSNILFPYRFNTISIYKFNIEFFNIF